ncbi:MAG: hypothetical protein JSR60_14295 [Proteobacteria bacterium]|nr:hypothetical protein [Pseudomonadota bacterium]
MRHAVLKIMRLKALAGACGLALCIAGPALADDAPITDINNWLAKYRTLPKEADSFSFDFGIPTSPALALIGTSTAISSPSAAMKPYVFSLPASFGGSKDAQAFTADASVAWLAQSIGASQRVSFEDFIDDAKTGELTRLAYRTRFEGALELGDDGAGDPSKAKASRLALGFSASILSSSDPVTVTDKDGDNVWDTCVDGVFSSKANQEYIDTFNNDPTLNVAGMITKANAPINGAIADIATDSYTYLDNDLRNADILITTCLANGNACSKYDTGKTLASAQGELRTAADAWRAAWAAQKAAPGNSSAQQNFDAATSDLETKVNAVDAALNQLNSVANQDVRVSSTALADKLGITKALNACTAKANAAARLGADLDVGAGVVWSGTPGKAEHFADANGAVWISGRLPVGIFDPDSLKLDSSTASLMLGGALRATFGQPVTTGNTATPSIKADVFDAWIGLERYSASSRIAAQVGYIDVEANDPTLKTFNRSGTRWLVTASLRADKLFGGLLNGGLLTGALLDDKSGEPPQNGVWVNVSYGSSGGTGTTIDDKTAMISLSYSPGGPFNLFGEGL